MFHIYDFNFSEVSLYNCNKYNLTFFTNDYVSFVYSCMQMGKSLTFMTQEDWRRPRGLYNILQDCGHVSFHSLKTDGSVTRHFHALMS